jgi:hypothetical protein
MLMLSSTITTLITAPPEAERSNIRHAASAGHIRNCRADILRTFKFTKIAGILKPKVDIIINTQIAMTH